jgi:hypothetical protein
VHKGDAYVPALRMSRLFVTHMLGNVRVDTDCVLVTLFTDHANAEVSVDLARFQPELSPNALDGRLFGTQLDLEDDLAHIAFLDPTTSYQDWLHVASAHGGIDAPSDG